jgi:hypothetical protein
MKSFVRSEIIDFCWILQYVKYCTQRDGEKIIYILYICIYVSIPV